MENERDKILQIVGKNIKVIRNSKSISQEKLAEKLNKSVNMISLIELGKSGMSIQTFIELCNTLEVDANTLFKGLLAYNMKEKDKCIIDNISAFSDKDKNIVIDLIKYITETKEC